VNFLSDFKDELFGGYTILWSANINNEQSFFSNETLIETAKISKLRLTLRGYYPKVQNDIRQLYYDISELRIKGR